MNSIGSRHNYDVSLAAIDLNNFDVWETTEGVEAAIDCFGTAGTLGTMTGCFGTLGTFGSLGGQI